MWVRVDDGFMEHPKVTRAAELLGRGGLGRVVAVWLEAQCYCARNLTDGYISAMRARGFLTDKRPLDVLEVMALPDVKLMKKTDAGYRFHDYEDYQPSADEVRAKLEKDRRRKVRRESDRNPNGIHAESATPVPVPPVPSGQKDQRAARAGLDAVKRHLLKAAHLSLDADIAISESELAADVKSVAARLGVSYTGRAIGAICDSARAARRRAS